MSLEDDLSKARFTRVDTSRNHDGDLRRVEATVRKSTAGGGSEVDLKYIAPNDTPGQLKLTKIDDNGTAVTVSKLVYAVVYAERALPARVPDVETVQSLSGRLTEAEALLDELVAEV